MAKNKVFLIGYPKTATTSLNKALEILGYSGRKGPADLIDAIDSNNWDPIHTVINEYDTLNDIPWPKLYKTLFESYPKAKYILTLRDEAKWITSLEKHFGYRYFPHHEWFYGSGIVMGNQEIYLKSFEAHNSEVLDFFRGNTHNFLSWDLTKDPNWKTLTDFLDISPPNAAFPFENKSPNINRYKSIRRVKDILITISKRLRSSSRNSKY